MKKNKNLGELESLISDDSNYKSLIIFAQYLLKGSLEDAEDAVHKVFLLLWEKAKEKSLKEGTTITLHFFKACLRNYILGSFRTRERKISYYNPHSEDEYSQNKSNHGDSYTELLERLDYYISTYCRFNDTEKIIWEAYKDGLKPQEIEEQFGIKHASQKRTRILEKIRASIPGYVYEDLKNLFIEAQSNCDRFYEISREDLIKW